MRHAGNKLNVKVNEGICASESDAEFEAKFDACLAKRAAGVQAALNVEYKVARGMVLIHMQELRRRSKGDGDLTLLANYVIADTGATIRVIGCRDMGKAVNVTELPSPIIVSTVNGEVEVTHMGDLEGYKGLMNKCLVIPTSNNSLLPIPTICEGVGLGFHIPEGGGDGVLTKEGMPYAVFDSSRPGLQILPAPADSVEPVVDNNREGL